MADTDGGRKELGGASRLFSRSSLTGTTALLAYLGIAVFAAHMAFAGNYGYFRDELYYIVSGTQHLSLGYVDFPPFIAYVAALLYPISGDSLVSIHVVPALNEALLVFVAGMIARELGGGRRAQLLAAVATLVALAYLAFGSLFTPDSFDSLWWSLLAYLVIRIARRREPKLWTAAGLVVGIGMLTKLTILFFVAALLVSFLAIPSARGYLRSKWLALGALISVVFILPMTYWNAVNGWPMVHFYTEFTGDFSGGGPLSFLYSQVAIMSYLSLPIIAAGFYFYLRSREGSQLRVLGLAPLILLVFMTALNMKVYYLAPVYPMLLAGGAVLIERGSSSKKGVSRWFGSRPFVACLIIVGVLLAPIAMPILSPSTFVSKYSASDYQSSPNADRFGWSLYVSNLSQAYNTLPASVRSQACILTSNYGEASAVNFLGRGSGLPEAISGHNNYYIWGPGSCTGHVLITVGYSLSDDQNSFGNVTLLTTLTCQYCISYEQNLPVYLCTKPTFSSLASVWPLVRHYD
ncbi:MAG TPA: glycosyltransferase family 39 protein [Nitrososphaerales archaeon]|nr:glycosyltransferase family 39 protein [Nitrososphaerales archaeon]